MPGGGWWGRRAGLSQMWRQVTGPGRLGVCVCVCVCASACPCGCGVEAEGGAGPGWGLEVIFSLSVFE